MKKTRTWEQKLNGYFIGFARKVFRWSPAYRETVQRAKQKEGKEELYRCENCKRLVKQSEKQVDHVEPVVQLGTVWNGDWNVYRDRLFVDSSKLQVLCKTCHKEKTGKENKRRKECKKNSASSLS